MTADSDTEECPNCGSRELRRLVSRFRHGRSEDARIDAVADRLEQMGDPESASSMREMVKEMGKAMDDDMSDDLEEMFESDMDESELED